jgi:F0F1-type ATP synthase assembly protein I
MVGDAEEPGGWQFAGAGLELAGAVLVCMGCGYLLDRGMDWQRPWGLVGGALIGFAVGMARLVRLANRFNRGSGPGPQDRPESRTSEPNRQSRED